MNQNFLAYLDLIELLLFFSGYPLIYLLIKSLGDNFRLKQIFKKNISSLLPVAYAIVGVLYVGLQLKNLYPDYSIEYIGASLQLSFLKLWAAFSILFFIPLLSKKPVFSLLHSLVFFYFIVKGLVLHFSGSIQLDSVRNSMNIYSVSLLINFCVFVVVVIAYLGYKKLKKTD